MDLPVRKSLTVDWLTDPEVSKISGVLNPLNNDDFQTLFVGGCVRDTLTHRAVIDIDMATKLRPEEVVSLAEKAGYKAIPTGIDHGTVTLVVGQKNIEVTTLRQDVETDGRRAVTAFTTDWKVDAERRDFTINTLLMDVSGNVYDPLDRGVTDIEARRVVFVGNAETRIREDVLRIIRFYRFHCALGTGEPDAEALDACLNARDLLPTLSKERITQELLKILSLDNSGDILGYLFENNILPDGIFDRSRIEAYKSFISRQVQYDARDTLARLAFLMSDMGGVCDYLVLSRAQMSSLGQYNWAFFQLNYDVRLFCYLFDKNITLQSALRCGSAGEELDLIKEMKRPEFPVKAQDLIGQGFEGAALGRRLKELESEWIKAGLPEDFKAT